MLQYLLLRISHLLDRGLPRRLVYAAATTAGDVAFRLWIGKRDIAIANAAQLLGQPRDDGRAWELARRWFQNYARYLAEFIHLPEERVADLVQRVGHVVGYEHLEAAIARGKGAIVVTAHFGNWDLAGAVLAAYHPLVVVGDTFQPACLDRLVQGTRAAKGMRVVPRERAVRPLLAWLRRNGVVALLADRPALDDAGGVAVSFFGRRTVVPAGAAALALKTGAAVLPAGCWRNDDDSYTGVIAPPIECSATGHHGRDRQEGMQQIMSAVERIICHAPDQWYMFRPMWPGRLMPPPAVVLAVGDGR